MTELTVGFDTLGGDDFENSLAFDRNIQAVKKLIEESPDLISDQVGLVLLGDENKLETKFKNQNFGSTNISFFHAPVGAGMNEIFNRRDNNSISQLASLQKSGEIQAGFSNGSSDIYVQHHALILKRKSEPRTSLIERVPALSNLDNFSTRHPTSFIQVFPKINGGSTILGDLGGTPKYEPLDYLFLLENIFESMGFHPRNNKKNLPKWGILNIGEEAKKGTEEIRLARDLLESVYGDSSVGFVEPGDIYGLNQAKLVDIILVDGMGGNQVLKTAEATAKFMGARMKQVLTDMNGMQKFGAGVAKTTGTLGAMSDKLKPASYGRMAAEVTGLNGVVFVGHGSASANHTIISLRNTIDGLHKHLD